MLKVDEQGMEANDDFLKLFNVVELLNTNIQIMASQVHDLQIHIDEKVEQMCQFLNDRTSMGRDEINRLFEFKESYGERTI